MRAKVRVGAVMPVSVFEGSVTQERVSFHAVAKSGAYPNDGSDEDNTFAKYTPSASFDLLIANPELIGAYEPGQTYYVDFTPVD
ncbi:hypothetical protein GVN18_39245 [Pseudomonas sp. ODNR1LW]|nr:hypothetical protein [Pseudomonas sp. ODNR1LW]